MGNTLCHQSEKGHASCRDYFEMRSLCLSTDVLDGRCSTQHMAVSFYACIQPEERPIESQSSVCNDVMNE